MVVNFIIFTTIIIIVIVIIIIIVIALIGAFISIFPTQLNASQGYEL